jgi:ABC-type uncharacterized transport system substrate-binding protein
MEEKTTKSNVTEAMKCEWRMQALQLATSVLGFQKDKPLDTQELLKAAKEWSGFVLTGAIGPAENV